MFREVGTSCSLPKFTYPSHLECPLKGFPDPIEERIGVERLERETGERNRDPSSLTAEARPSFGFFLILFFFRKVFFHVSLVICSYEVLYFSVYVSYSDQAYRDVRKGIESTSGVYYWVIKFE